MSRDPFTLEGAKVLRISDYAVLVLWEEQETWIPTSQIEPESEITEHSQPGDVGDLVVADWLARKEGWV